MRARVALFREIARESARDIACGNEAARAARGGTRGFDPERGANDANDANDAKAACAAFAPDPLRAPLSRSAQLHQSRRRCGLSYNFV